MNKIIPFEIVIPIKPIFFLQNKVIEFQNCTSIGAPFCSRIFFTRVEKTTNITIYIRYPLPESIKNQNISAESFSIIMQEILMKNSEVLKLHL